MLPTLSSYSPKKNEIVNPVDTLESYVSETEIKYFNPETGEKVEL